MRILQYKCLCIYFFISVKMLAKTETLNAKAQRQPKVNTVSESARSYIFI